MNYTFGIIFHHEDKLCMAIYNDSGNIKNDFINISSQGNIYNKLEPNELSFVLIENDEYSFKINEIKTLTIEQDFFSAEEIIPKLFEFDQFYNMAAEIYKNEVSDILKEIDKEISKRCLSRKL